MCSQPPTKHDDSWLVKQALEIIDHLSYEPMNIGLTGGAITARQTVKANHRYHS